jgi:hypothetical protein
MLFHPGVEGRKILIWIFRKLVGGMHWIALVEDRYSWRELVELGMNLRVPQNSRNFFTS